MSTCNVTKIVDENDNVYNLKDAGAVHASTDTNSTTGDTEKFLNQKGNWAKPPIPTNTAVQIIKVEGMSANESLPKANLGNGYEVTIPNAVATGDGATNGLMTAADKAKIDGLGSLSGKNTVNINSDTNGILTCDKGGTGANSARNAANAFINALTTGESTPEDNDFFVSQYVGGGTTTTTFHRRKFRTLWSYIKSKLLSDSGVNISGNAADSAKWNGYSLVIGSVGTADNTIYIA